MTHIPHGAHIAAAQPAEERKRGQEQEEEEMTNYTNHDMAGEWEFKIICSTNNAFRSPERLGAVLEEEAAAGWELIEKLDDSRVRLKRKQSSRRRDAELPPGFDPYRTKIGLNSQAATMIIGLILAFMLGVGVLVMMGAETGIDPTVIPVIAIVVGILIAVFAVGFAVRRLNS